eukprot:15463746-Alexandrium_andersonii.AAC.1
MGREWRPGPEEYARLLGSAATGQRPPDVLPGAGWQGSDCSVLDGRLCAHHASSCSAASTSSTSSSSARPRRASSSSTLPSSSALRLAHRGRLGRQLGIEAVQCLACRLQNVAYLIRRALPYGYMAAPACAPLAGGRLQLLFRRSRPAHPRRRDPLRRGAGVSGRRSRSRARGELALGDALAVQC